MKEISEIGYRWVQSTEKISKDRHRWVQGTEEILERSQSLVNSPCHL